MPIDSTADALLVGIPMVFILLLVYFRLDEAFTTHPTMLRRRPLAGGVDVNGMPICVDPDGKPIGRLRFRERGEGSGRGPGMAARAPGVFKG
jgi:hypothetical protein